jgi:hypothetical protein
VKYFYGLLLRESINFNLQFLKSYEETQARAQKTPRIFLGWIQAKASETNHSQLVNVPRQPKPLAGLLFYQSLRSAFPHNQLLPFSHFIATSRAIIVWPAIGFKIGWSTAFMATCLTGQ